jgi:hypothetical protein
MEGVEIQLNGKTFVLNFGMKVIRLLIAKWQVPGLNDVFQKLSIFSGMTDNLTIEQIDVINDLIVCSIEANKDNTETITADEIDELYLTDPQNLMKQIEIVFKGFMASMPQAKEVGKPKAARKK